MRRIRRRSASAHPGTPAERGGPVDRESPATTEPARAVSPPARRTARVRAVVRGHSTRWWVNVAIVFVTAVLYSIAWPTLMLTHEVSPALAPLVSALATWPFLLVRANPVLGWAISIVSAVAVGVVFDTVPPYQYPWQVVHIIVLMVLIVVAVAWSPPPVALGVWIVSSGVFVAQMPGGDRWGWLIGVAALCVLGFLVGRLVVSRRALVLEQETSDLERARRSALEERARIARDLHDVVAHHMSRVVVQAQTAPYRLDAVSPEIHAEFDAIGAAAREALDEVRTLLGVLRSDDTTVTVAPQPGGADVADLVDGARRSGMDLDASVPDTVADLPDAVGLALYRILQESLSNAARHAAGTPVRVTVTHRPSEVTLAVVNGAPPEDGPAETATPERAGGNGIAGMYDRAAAVGGRLVAGADTAGGFGVRAVLPLARAESGA